MPFPRRTGIPNFITIGSMVMEKLTLENWNFTNKINKKNVLLVKFQFSRVNFSITTDPIVMKFGIPVLLGKDNQPYDHFCCNYSV